MCYVLRAGRDFSRPAFFLDLCWQPVIGGRHRVTTKAGRHAASAGEVFADVAAEAETEVFCGLEFTALQFAADRAAQLTYKIEGRPTAPQRIFPFVLQPTPMPFA